VLRSTDCLRDVDQQQNHFRACSVRKRAACRDLDAIQRALVENELKVARFRSKDTLGNFESGRMRQRRQGPGVPRADEAEIAEIL
jgi:hypothetical protein